MVRWGELHAVILERNKLVGRKVARLFLSVGATAVTVEEPSRRAAARRCRRAVRRHVRRRLRRRAGARASRGCAACCGRRSRCKRSLKYLVETNTINHVLGRKDFESPPRAWEVLHGRAPLRAVATSRRRSLRISTGASRRSTSTCARRRIAIARSRRSRLFVGALQLPKRVAEMFGELAHELLMNAMYDAPVDAHGTPKYAADRKADIQLADDEQPTVRIGDRRLAARAASSRSVRPPRAPARRSTVSRAASPAARWISPTVVRGWA